MLLSSFVASCAASCGHTSTFSSLITNFLNNKPFTALRAVSGSLALGDQGGL
jgi:hypothetical protein